MYLPWAYIQSELSSLLESISCLKKIIKLISKNHNAEPVRKLGVVMDEAVRWLAGWKARSKEHIAEDLAPNMSTGGNDLTSLVMYCDTMLIDAAKEFKKHFLFLLVLKLMVRHEIDLWPEAKKLCYAASIATGALCDTIGRLAVIQRHLDENRRLEQMGLYDKKEQFSWAAFKESIKQGGTLHCTVSAAVAEKKMNAAAAAAAAEGGEEEEAEEKVKPGMQVFRKLNRTESSKKGLGCDEDVVGPSIGPCRLFGDAGMGREKAAVYTASVVAGAEGDDGGSVKVLCIERSSYKKVVAMEICRTLRKVAGFEGATHARWPYIPYPPYPPGLYSLN